MLLTNKRMVEDSSRLYDLSQKQLPVKASYAIAKNISKIEPELVAYNKERAKLMGLYCNEADNDGNFKLKEECVKDWNKSIKELLEIENNIDIHKFSIEVLEGVTITAAELILIDYMIEE